MNTFKQPECHAPRVHDKWKVDKWNNRQWLYTIKRLSRCWCSSMSGTGRCKMLDSGRCNGKRAVIHYGWRDQSICVWEDTDEGVQRLSQYYVRTKKGDRWQEYEHDREQP